MTKSEMIKQLSEQVSSLTSTVDSLNATINAQTQLITQLNQTIQELMNNLTRIPKTVPNLHQVTALKSLLPKVSVNRPALSVALNTVGAVSIKCTHEILSGVFNIPLATNKNHQQHGETMYRWS